jgi:AraC-like DNA-binding protein
MSKMRQTADFDHLSDKNAWIVTLAKSYPGGYVIPLHFHDRDQLVYASRGVMTVRTANGTWMVPPQRAVWIPKTVPHTITMSGDVAMRTLYLKPRLATSLPRNCIVVNVMPLLRELILCACTAGSLRGRIARERHLLDVILDQLHAIELVPLQLPSLSEPRANRVAHALRANPADPRSLDALCTASGASRRTVERIFQHETGMPLGRWRQQLRLMHAMCLVAEGAKVTQAALAAGYSTASAFVAAFRKVLGTTPTRYLRAHPGTNTQVPDSQRQTATKREGFEGVNRGRRRQG